MITRQQPFTLWDFLPYFIKDDGFSIIYDGHETFFESADDFYEHNYSYEQLQALYIQFVTTKNGKLVIHLY